MNIEFIRQRITQLRVQRGMSEYQLSYELGHSKNYVRNIVCGYSQPSVSELLYMIEVLGVSPKDFFDSEIEYPIAIQEILDGLKHLNTTDLNLIGILVRRLNEQKQQ